MQIKYFFRKPVFPIICNIKGNLIAAKSGPSFSKKLSSFEFDRTKSYVIIDATGEGWTLYAENMIISPLTFKKKWTKLEIIRLYNERKNKINNEKPYSEKSLSAKRLDKIITDIVDLSL